MRELLLFLQLAEYFRKMTSNLRDLTGKVQNVSVKVTKTVQELSTSSQQMKASKDQISNATHGIAAEGANSASTTAQQVGKMSGDVAQKMTEIQSTVDNSATMIRQLDGKSQQIGEIIGLITNIADQTNLLAVVADEVRKLAEESRNAANQITGLIKDIQQGTKQAVTSMEQGTKTVG